MAKITQYPKKLNFAEYEHSFSYELLKDFEEGRFDGFDTETMRGLIYGYTFTDDYAKGVVPETFSMEYWASKKDVPNRGNYNTIDFNCAQEQLIYDAINSTGLGLDKDDPICVICVGHEYEILKKAWPMTKIKKQRLLSGNIDCFDLEVNIFRKWEETIYFDINRWFEKVNIFKD